MSNLLKRTSDCIFGPPVVKDCGDKNNNHDMIDGVKRERVVRAAMEGMNIIDIDVTSNDIYNMSSSLVSPEPACLRKEFYALNSDHGNDPYNWGQDENGNRVTSESAVASFIGLGFGETGKTNFFLAISPFSRCSLLRSINSLIANSLTEDGVYPGQGSSDQQINDMFLWVPVNYVTPYMRDNVLMDIGEILMPGDQFHVRNFADFNLDDEGILRPDISSDLYFRDVTINAANAPWTWKTTTKVENMPIMPHDSQAFVDIRSHMINLNRAQGGYVSPLQMLISYQEILTPIVNRDIIESKLWVKMREYDLQAM
jgi:hypothetical protein